MCRARGGVHMRYELTVDPGGTGGAWLGEVDRKGRCFTRMAWSWKPCKLNKQPAWKVITAVGLTEQRYCAELHAVGSWIRDSAIEAGGAREGWRLTVEGLFGRGHTLERLAWAAGLVAGPLLAGAVGAVERPLAMQWRKQLLDIGPRTPAEVCDELVAKWAMTAATDVPLAVRNSHVLDAVALAAWRTLTDNG